MADKPPEPPDGFDLGSYDDAVVDDGNTRTVWVEDDDKGVAYWFELQEDVPLSKKNRVLENNLTTEKGDDGKPRQNLSSDYYRDLLEYMVVDWFGADDPDADPLPVFLTKMTAVFEDLQDEVPRPFGGIDDGDKGK